MSRTRPAPAPLRQESDDTCALACLRMVLAHHGLIVSEPWLAEQAEMQPGGIGIGELHRLARFVGLDAELVQLDLDAMADLISEGLWAIAYLNRAHFAKRSDARTALRSPVVHAVVPIRVGRRYVTYNEPLLGSRRRVSRDKFASAQRDLSFWCLLCRSWNEPPR